LDWNIANSVPSTAIGVDEIKYAKGHKYLTLVYQIDLDVTRLLWIGKERTIESFQGFFTTIGDEVASKIVFVCSDMWEPYLKVNGEEPIMRRKLAGYLSLLVPGQSYLAIIKRPLKASRATPSLHLSFPTGGLGGSRSPIHVFQSLAFGFDIGSCVDIGRVEAFMSKPTANHRHVNLCRDKAYSRGVPEPLWGYSLANQ
jgi:hypothetical protein